PPESPSQSPALSVQISTSFPSSEIFGVKLVNAVPTLAVLSITNNEPSPINVVFIGGSLWTVPDTPSSPPTPQIVRNLTTTRYNDVSIPAGEKESIEYRFKTELQPQDLLLNLAVVVTDEKGEAFTIPAFNETVAVVERDTSIFDPQMLVPSLLPPIPHPSSHRDQRYPFIPFPFTSLHKTSQLTHQTPQNAVYSSTSSSSPFSPARSTSSTAPGSPPSSHNPPAARSAAAAEKTPPAPAPPPRGTEKSILPIRWAWRARMARRPSSRAVPKRRGRRRRTMRVGSPRGICRGPGRRG
ncbi:MAG: hypothetical protein Q9197_007039, partial [Variospora fuerteventurae]